MPNPNDRRRQVGRPRSVVNRSARSRPRQTATADAPYTGADLPKENLASLKDIDREEQVLIVRTLVRALAIIDHFDPVRNPASSMRQLRTLFASARLRAALRRLESE